jgi:N-acyl-L-homoserine lactone synthetase
MKPVSDHKGTGGESRLTILEPGSSIRRSGSRSRGPHYFLSCGNTQHQHELEIRFAETVEDRERVYRLRHIAYCGPGKDLPDQPDGLERDAYDSEAILLLAWLDGVPVGTVRITFMRENRFLLETFEEGGVPIVTLPLDVPRSETAEPSRMVVIHDVIPACVYSPCISTALFHGAFTASRAVGMKHWVFEANAKNLRAIQRLGWKIVPIGKPLLHHGQRFDAFTVPLHPDHFSWELPQS